MRVCQLTFLSKMLMHTTSDLEQLHAGNIICQTTMFSKYAFAYIDAILCSTVHRTVHRKTNLAILLR
jgi:hypothetical protein